MVGKESGEVGEKSSKANVENSNMVVEITGSIAPRHI